MERGLGWLRRRPRFWVVAPPIFCLFAVCIAALGLIITPLPVEDISPLAAPEVWTVTAPWDSSFTPTPAKGMELGASGRTLYLTRTLPDVPADDYLLSVFSGRCDVAFFLDGTLVASPSGRYLPGVGFPPLTEDTPPPPSGYLVTLPRATGRELTLAIQYCPSDLGRTDVGGLPTISLYADLMTYQSQYLSIAISEALPAGFFLALAVLTVGLSLFQLYRGRSGWDILLLALAALMWCVWGVLPFGYSVMLKLQSPMLVWLLPVAIPLPVLFHLWLRTRGKVRRYGWVLPALCTAAVLVCAAPWVTGPPGLWSIMLANLLKNWVLPAAFGITLLVGGWEAKRGNAWFRSLFLLSALGLALVALGWILSHLWGRPWSGMLEDAFQLTVSLPGLGQLMTLGSGLLLIVCLLLSASDFVRATAHADSTLQALALENRYAAENAAILNESLDSARRTRHEFRHHLEAIRALSYAGNGPRLAAYLERLAGLEDDQPLRYTENQLVNALITRRLRQAQAAGVQVEAMVCLPQRLEIDDADLSILLTNLLDNAVEAATAVEEPERRFLNLTLGIQNRSLFICCENSFHGAPRFHPDGTLLSTKRGEGHGFGLDAMQSVAKKYGSLLLVEHGEGWFKVKTCLPLPAAPPAREPVHP